MTFEPGELEKEVEVIIINDDEKESNEFFCLMITEDGGSQYYTTIIIPENDCKLIFLKFINLLKLYS